MKSANLFITNPSSSINLKGVRGDAIEISVPMYHIKQMNYWYGARNQIDRIMTLKNGLQDLSIVGTVECRLSEDFIHFYCHLRFEEKDDEIEQGQPIEAVYEEEPFILAIFHSRNVFDIQIQLHTR